MTKTTRSWLKGLKVGASSPPPLPESPDLATSTSPIPPLVSPPLQPSNLSSSSIPTTSSTTAATAAAAATTTTAGSGSSSTLQARPKLNYKSRSSHTFRPLSSYFGAKDSSSSAVSNASNSSLSQQELKKQRDSFILQRQMDNIGNSPVFGVSLEESVGIAEGKIYISSDSNGLVVYGRIPRVVASCGLYLKKNGLDIEGIFRVAGSNKRIKQLQIIFSSPPDYGAKIDWDGFTVHDAASLLRRYLGALPEPLIPLALYEDFRDPLRSRPAILKYLKDKEKRMSHTPSAETKPETTDATSTAKPKTELTDDEKKRRKKHHKQKLARERNEALEDYARLFDKLPELRRQLLFYILDLLAIFNMHAEKNRMPAKNLAAVFQPSILSHSDHDMSPDEYALSSLVVEFMIEYSHKILPAAQESARLAEAEKEQQQGSKTASKLEPLPPPTSYAPRRHSKSLSSVQTPSDMIRVTNSRSKLAMVKTNSTDDLGMTTEEEENSATGGVAASAAPAVTSTNTPDVSATTPDATTVAITPVQPPAITTSTSHSPITPTFPLEHPPPINVDNVPIISTRTPTSPDTLQSADSHSSSSPHSPSHHFLHSLAKPLNILSSPRLSPRGRSQSGATSENITPALLSDNVESTPLEASGSNTESPSKEKKGWLNKLRSRSNSRTTNN
ncbi:DEKNAAC104294 [Brettanomyces naardenensis]|uniref:DEKNAAC104295 n=1 Tax=Brettanomyces naardenensis TaxID=13370 RepID=A0A448YQ98_BRENA|nr:DEKNAAC104294 [Brettanomyces naardenensis]